MKDIPLIIARSLLRIAKKEEKDSLSKWEGISWENTFFVQGMEEYWNLPIEEIPDKKLNAVRKRLLIRLNTKISKPIKRSLIYYSSRIAAAMFFIISIAGLSVYVASKTVLFYAGNEVEISTEAGQQSKVTLPDGSSVWLNSETIVKYDAAKGLRKVSLLGEAYFEVSHDSERPFIVETGNTKIKVLGTKFNVSHYPDSKMTEASLLAGKITLTLPGSSKKIALKPGQKLSYNAEKHVYLKQTIEVQNEILWRQGILFFENELFNDLIRKLERYYAVKIIYDEGIFGNLHYTGTLDNLSIKRVLDFINLTIPIKYEIENKTIKLHSTKNAD